MREIKFRAWVKNEYDGDDLVEYMEEDASCFVNPFEDHEDGEIILMQYTGIKDNDGIEIYEGDIVKMICPLIASDSLDIVGEVKMLEGSWHVDSGERLQRVWSEVHQVKVVGNVYEHAHPLKQEDPS